MRVDHKELLDELGFVWNVEDHQWNLQYEKMVEFKRKNGHCVVKKITGPKDAGLNKTLGKWVANQRGRHANNKLRLDRKVLLDELGFVWRAATVPTHSSTTDVSCRWWFISSFIQVIFLTLVVFLLNLCIRIRIRKRPPAVWAFQTRH
jgi:hypothetical protein